MGDRIALRFRTGEQVSPWLYSHWEGMALLEAARAFAKRMIDLRTVDNDEPLQRMPSDRLEPDVLMVGFVRDVAHALYGTRPVKGDLRLTVDNPGGDDNGEWEIIFDPEDNSYKVARV